MNLTPGKDKCPKCGSDPLLYCLSPVDGGVQYGFREAVCSCCKTPANILYDMPRVDSTARKVEFIYDLDQMVVTNFGEDGIVTMLGFDDGGVKYYIDTKDNARWHKEEQLSLPRKSKK